MARIALIYFDVSTGYYPSLHHGIAYLIGALRSNNKVSLHHLLSQEQVEEIGRGLACERVDVVGLSFTTHPVRYVREFLKSWKRQGERLVIAGGVHPTLEKERILEQFPEIDGVCVGEGENAFALLCERIDKNEDFLQTPSFVFRDGVQIVSNPVMQLAKIESLSYPDYSLFDYKKIIRDNGEAFPMMLSRGCPFDCSYCCNHAFRGNYPSNSKYIRIPPAAYAISLLQSNLKLYPQAKRIVFADDTFTLNKKWLREFCDLYRENVQVPFQCNGRVETIDEEIADILKGAGCMSVDFGVESGNEWLRMKVLNRKHSNNAIKQAFSVIQSRGMKTFSFNMVGLPFETEKMALDTLSLNKQLKPDYGRCFFFFPYPGTNLFKICTQYGMAAENIETMSGYLDGPSLIPVFMTPRQTVAAFRKINMFFNARLIITRIRLPSIGERLAVNLCILLRDPLMRIINPGESSGPIKSLRGLLRRIAVRYFR